MNSLNYPKVAHCQVLGEQLCRASSGSRLKALAMFTMLSLFVATLQAVNIDAGMDTVICKGQSHTLGGNPTASGGVAPYSYEWTSDPAGFTSSDSTPVVSPTQKTTYFLKVTDAQGFECKDTVEVEVAWIDRLKAYVRNEYPRPVSRAYDPPLDEDDFIITTEGTTGSVTVDIVIDQPDNLSFDARRHILWKVCGGNASPDNGNFYGAVNRTTLSVSSDADREVEIKAGCDINADQILDSTEVEYTIKVYIIKLTIKATPPQYFSDAESNVPVVLKVIPEDAPIDKSKFSNIKVEFRKPSLTTFSISNSFLHNGDLMGEDFTTPNLFTLVITEARYNSIHVANDVVKNPSYLVKAVYDNRADLKSNKYTFERYGDKTNPVYEIGVAGASNGTYNMNNQPSQWVIGKAKQYKQAWSSLSGNSMTFGLFEFSEIVNTRSGGKTSFSLLIKYDTDENFPYNGHKLRLTNAGETRGVHTMVFYGRKSVGGATDIVDTAQNEADVNIDAFKGVGHMFTYSWGQTYAIYSEADFGDQVLWVSGLGVALASIGTVNFWNPGGAGLLTLAGVAIGVAAAIKAAHIMASGEWASVHMAGAYLVKTQGGSIRRHGYFPDVNNDPKLATVRLAPSSEGFSTSGSQNENWNIGNAGNPTDVKVGEKISAVVSGSIQAGSKSGTAFGLFDYCLDVKLEFDVSGDPTLKISE